MDLIYGLKSEPYYIHVADPVFILHACLLSLRFAVTHLVSSRSVGIVDEASMLSAHGLDSTWPQRACHAVHVKMWCGGRVLTFIRSLRKDMPVCVSVWVGGGHIAT